MRTLRGLLALVFFVPGIFALAAGSCWVLVSLAESALVQPPLGTLLLGALPGFVAAVVGVGLLFISRAMDGTRRPVLRYGRTRARQRQRARA